MGATYNVQVHTQHGAHTHALTHSHPHQHAHVQRLPSIYFDSRPIAVCSIARSAKHLFVHFVTNLVTIQQLPSSKYISSRWSQHWQTPPFKIQRSRNSQFIDPRRSSSCPHKIRARAQRRNCAKTAKRWRLSKLNSVR